MAWAWSHTQDAYQNAFENLNNLPDDEIRVIWSEIQSAQMNDNYHYDFNPESYERYLTHCQDINPEFLAYDIWEFMQEFETCDNGGFNAYCCPFGCHTVPFDKIEQG